MATSMKAVWTAAVWTCAAGAIVCAAGCNKRATVERRDPTTVTDLDYRFSDDDARAVAQQMISTMLAAPRVQQWVGEQGGRRPVVIIGTVANDTSDYIDTKLFTKQIERTVINSGVMDVVASRDERGEIRDERLQSREWSRPETVKRIAFEMGADLMLIGRVGENVQLSPDRKKRVQYYQVNMELVDIESNVKVWADELQVEKYVRYKP